MIDYLLTTTEGARVLAGFLTLSAAIVASSTAIYIALFVYRKQKQEDRKLQVAAELRRNLSGLSGLLPVAEWEYEQDGRPSKETHARLNSFGNGVLLYADEELLKVTMENIAVRFTLARNKYLKHDQESLVLLEKRKRELEIETLVLSRDTIDPEKASNRKVVEDYFEMEIFEGKIDVSDDES